MSTPGAKATAEVAKRLEDLPEQFVDCRDPGIRHAWQRLNNFHTVPGHNEAGTVIKHLGRDTVCMRCDTVKRERFDLTRNGVVKTGTTYDYPQGYLLPGIPRGVTPSTIIYQMQYNKAMAEAANAAAGERPTAER